MTDSDRNISRLARRLAVNHIYLSSIRGLDHAGWKTIMPGFVRADEKETRVIAVVGAGASAPSGLPVSKDAAALLQKRLDIDPDELKEELERLTSVYRLSTDDLETLLMAMGTTVRRARQLRDELGLMYAHSHPPVLTYEILAHLLKHRFVDAIVNFNFDELLDQSIRDEIGEGNYHHILSDGHCLNLKRDRFERYELPIYIKPHGTASHKSTLRFTREDYFGVPEDIRALLIALATGLPLTLILVGFGMQSFEFNQVLRGTAEDIDVYSFNTDDLNIDKRLKSEIGRPVRWNHVRLAKTRNGLDSQFESLWEAVSALFPEDFRPRTLCRHRLIHDLFRTRIKPNCPKQGRVNQASERRQYLGDRMVVEMALAIAKGKGLVDLTTLTNDRCGRYYELFRASEPNVLPLCEYFLKLGLLNVSYARDVVRLTRPTKDRDTSEYPILTEAEFMRQMPTVRKKVLGLLQSTTVSRNFDRSKSQFNSAMRELYCSEEVEISNRPDATYPTRFHSHHVLPTFASLRYETLELLNDLEKDDILLSVAETGEWLLKNEVKSAILSKGFDLFIIVADRSHESNIRKDYKHQLVDVQQIPWWIHNRHMTILIRGNDVHGAIYFSRRLRAAMISPVKLEPPDSDEILRTFLAYWEKAEWINSSAKQEWATPRDMSEGLARLREIKNQVRLKPTRRRARARE